MKHSLRFLTLLFFLGSTLALAQTPNRNTRLIFYGGDANPSDPNVECLNNGLSLLQPMEQTWGSIKIPNPDKGKAKITGILFNVTADVAIGTVFDPMTADYEVCVNAAALNGCPNPVSEGSGALTIAATGRTVCGYPEYAASVNLTQIYEPPTGNYISFNLVPQCTNTGNSNCSGVTFYVENTTQQTNGINKGLQPAGQILYTGPGTGTGFANWCNNPEFPPLNNQQCARLSFGLYGF